MWTRRVLEAQGLLDVHGKMHATPPDCPELREHSHGILMREPIGWYWSAYCHLKDHFYRFEPERRGKGSALWNRFKLTRQSLDNFNRFMRLHAGTYSAIAREFCGDVRPFIIHTDHIAHRLCEFLEKAGQAIDRQTVLRTAPFNVTANFARGRNPRWWQEHEWTDELRGLVADNDGFVIDAIKGSVVLNA